MFSGAEPTVVEKVDSHNFIFIVGVMYRIANHANITYTCTCKVLFTSFNHR